MLRLVMIGRGGRLDEGVASESELVREIREKCKAHYERAGFYPPWCGYLAVRDDSPQGVCGFRGPPDSREQVEIAYRILPGYERQGLGSAMVSALVGIARDNNPQMAVLTHTGLDDHASSELLQRMGFTDAGETRDTWLGPARCWCLEPGREPRAL